MDDIELKQVEGKSLASSTVIAERLDIEHRALLQLLASYAEDFERFGRVAFEMDTFQSAGGPQQRRTAYLNEEQAYLLLTYARNTTSARECKIQLIASFRRARELATKAQLPSSYAEALRELANQWEHNQQLEQERKVLEQENTALAPRAAGYDALMDSSGLYLVREAAKLLGTGQTRLYSFMRERKLIFPQGTEPYQRFVDMGLFEVKARTYKAGNEERTARTTYVTPKGLEYLRRLLETPVQSLASVVQVGVQA